LRPIFYREGAKYAKKIAKNFAFSLAPHSFQSQGRCGGFAVQIGTPRKAAAVHHASFPFDQLLGISIVHYHPHRWA